MENFIVSARKYRPITFDSVVGQASITSTLKSAISTRHLAHAYLFCGPRGVGKTTCARIFAKTINCINLDSSAEACNTCESCKSFNESRSYNIHELDAASNNSVDDIRNLIDQVRIPPQIGKYSIYIIDEVHMLSQQAFNAFLKTLEEPPAHAIFILATTEKHKIIPTILSRCQIFDFNRIQVEDIVNYLEQISQKESIEYETDAFNIIAQKADGAMRDALSIYDQIVSFSDNKITYQKVIENLNILDYDYYFRLTDAFLQNDIPNVLLLFDEILSEGFDGHNFINSLSKHFRDLLVCKDEVTVQLLEAGKNIKEKYREQTSRCPVDFLYKAIDLCNTCDIGYKSSKNQRLHVELTLIRLGNLTDEKKNDEPQVKSEIKLSTDNPVSSPVISKAEKIQVPEQIQTTVTHTNDKSDNPVKDSVSEVKEEVKPIKKTYISKTPSIREALGNFGSTQKSEEVSDDVSSEDVVEEDAVQNTPFTIEDLLNTWNKYVESIKDEMPRMYSTLKNQQPGITGTGLLELEMKNNAQAEDFRTKVKPALMNFLRKELQNDLIELEEKITEDNGNGTKKLYTAEEKYRHMSQKNPTLEQLKQDFNLDFE